MRFSARVCSRRRCTRHGCTPAEETGTISQLDFGCGARRICVRLAHVASTWPEGSPAAQRCEHALISLACRHAAHGMSTRVQGIKPLRCASFTAVKQPSWPCTWPPPPQPLCNPTASRCTRLTACSPSPHRPLLFVIADAGLPPDAPSADTMMVFFATPSSTDRTLVAKLMEHSVSPDASA